MGTEGEVGRRDRDWGVREKGNVGKDEGNESGKSVEARQRGKIEMEERIR